MYAAEMNRQLGFNSLGSTYNTSPVRRINGIEHKFIC